MADPATTLASRLLSRVSPETVVRVHEPLAKRTTFRVGGAADCYVEPAGEEDLASLLKMCAESKVEVWVLGRGSNVLVRDGGVRGVVVSLASPAFGRVEVRGPRVVAGAGARLKTISQEARRAGVGGLEFLEGIPGSLGGALRMNAGAMGSATFDRVETLRVMTRDGTLRELERSQVEVGYRHCPRLDSEIALGAVLLGEIQAREAIEERSRSFNERRWETQPAAPSAGCIFRNPPGHAAGRMIDEAGLKGLRVGGAVVSDVHANFIVNEAGATAQDILELIQTVRERVRAATGVQLETEVQIVGEAGPPRAIHSEQAA